MCYMRATRWVSGMASTARAISLDPESKINPDSQKERDTATFNTLELTYVLDGGREITERRRYVGKCFCWINISKNKINQPDPVAMFY